MKLFNVFVRNLLVIPLCLFIRNSAVQAQMIADITNDVTTEWGTYHPNKIACVPNVPLFMVNPDLSNIINIKQFGHIKFTKQDTEFLLANHFTVKKSPYKQISDIYNVSTHNGVPLFITTDAVLHIYHILFDCLLTDIEIKNLLGHATLLTQTLFDSTQNMLSQAKKTSAREAVLRNMAFAAVPLKLIKDVSVTVPQSIAALVDSELALIAQHQGFDNSPILGSFTELDYSLFTPRGHYTKSEILKTYFKVMMWYGWTILTMEPQLFGDIARRHTLQALLMTQMLYKIRIQDKELFDIWKKIYDPTAFFIGKTDDPNIQDYRTIAEKVYGKEFEYLSADSLADSTLLNAFLTEAQKLPEPKIPNYILGSVDRFKGFRFMGQRFLPDSYMFAHLVLPEVDFRYFPMSLDIMAILGSQRAYFLLDSQYHQTEYPNYTQQIKEFKIEFSQKKDREWIENLYSNWLYCLMPLLYKKDLGYPFFMQTAAWSDKELMTALASWTELRHDAILYAKQSNTPDTAGGKTIRSYVEPNPHLYNRLANLVRYTCEGLSGMELSLAGYKEKLDLFESLLHFLTNVAIKELENTPLTETEYNNILCFGKVMKSLIVDPISQKDGYVDNMAIIADVHTDRNSMRCLEEGVGYPLEMYVVVNEGGVVRLTRGAIFSYHEFLQPIGQRLNDEQWRSMIDSGKAPPLPEWTAHFMDIAVHQPSLNQNSVENLYGGQFITTANKESVPLVNDRSRNLILINTGVQRVVYSVAVSDLVMLSLYNTTGKKVKTLVNTYKQQGTYSVWFDMSRMAKGAYVMVLKSGKNMTMQKLIAK